MQQNKSCEKCGSKKIIKGAKIKDFSHANIKRNLIIEIIKSKNFLFKNTEKREVLSDICGNCGRIELYIDDYDELWKIYNGN